MIGNFVADNIVFGREVLAHNPEEPPRKKWEFTNSKMNETGPLVQKLWTGLPRQNWAPINSKIGVFQ